VPDGASKKALDAGVSGAKALFAARYGAGFLAFFEGHALDGADAA
jgi:hypothetical protein